MGLKPSTLVELAGFTALIVGAWMLSTIAGVFTLGGCLLLIGYATEDAAASVALHRVTIPVRALTRRIRRKKK